MPGSIPGPKSRPLSGPGPGFTAHLPPNGNNNNLVGLKLAATTQWPQIEVVTCTTEQASLRLDVNASLTWFIGHFVGQPVLPGVVQTHWAGLIALELFTRETPLQFQQLLKLKFNSVVTPGQRLQLKLNWQHERQQCVFKYLDPGDKAVSSGTICFGNLAST